MTARVGDWMCTFSGTRFFVADPRPEEVLIEDIAHALAIEPRFGGHLDEPYSVAQHCVLASHIAEKHLGASLVEQKWALLHDAAEAYLKDIPRPLKRAIGDVYHQLERRVMAAITEKFELPHNMPPVVKKADEICLSIERRDLFPQSHKQTWTLGGEGVPLPEGISIGFIHWRDAEIAFKRRFAILFGAARGSAPDSSSVNSPVSLGVGK